MQVGQQFAGGTKCQQKEKNKKKIDAGALMKKIESDYKMYKYYIIFIRHR